MKKLLYIPAMMLVLYAFTHHSDNKKIFQQLTGLEGMWIMKTKNGMLGEEWIKINAKHLQNRGFMIRGADTMVTETVALQHNENNIVFTSTVVDQSKQAPVAFTLTSAASNTFVFENAAHDYPKRICYQLVTKIRCMPGLMEEKISRVRDQHSVIQGSNKRVVTTLLFHLT